MGSYANHPVFSFWMYGIWPCILFFLMTTAPKAGGNDVVPVVRDDGYGQAGKACAIIVIPADPKPIAQYAAQELVLHIKLASGVTLPLAEEPNVPDTPFRRIYVGSTRAALLQGISVDQLPSEAFVLRTADGDLFIAAEDGPGDPLSISNTFSGSLWGVYEVLDRDLGVRWLWPGDLGTFVPKADAISFGPYEETVVPRFVQRKVRPGIESRCPAMGDSRLAFTQEGRERYAFDQAVFLRRHRMGRSADTYFTERSAGSGHSFQDWWERYGEEHPEWFEMRKNARRGPSDLDRPGRVSMCVSNPGLHRKIVDLWEEERAKRPGERVNIGVGENDRPGECCCTGCRAWDGPEPDFDALPPGLERSYEPMQASNRYARFLKEVHALASETDPEVKVHFYAFENYFWAPSQDIRLNRNILIGFVPWFRWAGWFPRTPEVHEWIKQQWIGWRKAGVSLCYRPNWFLDGWSMPHVYPHQFADAFQFYARNGMTATDFDSLMGQWGAQAPHLYLLARIHEKPDEPADGILEEFYSAFGPAQAAVKAYFAYWEAYSFGNREKAADAIKKRGGKFRRYAKYGRVADELYSMEAFDYAQNFLDRAKEAAEGANDSDAAGRVAFLQEGLNHARLCVSTAKIMNDVKAAPNERASALDELIAYRRKVASLGIANLDRLSIVERQSWGDVPGFEKKE